MTDGDLYLYGGFILIIIAVLAYIFDSKKAGWIIDEKLGKKIEIKNENGTFSKPKDFPIEFFDGNKNKIYYAGVRPKGPMRYDLLDEQGMPFKEIDLRIPHIWMNCHNFMTGKGGSELVIQLVDRNYIQSLKDDLDAMHLAFDNKADEVVKHSQSSERIVQHGASAENKRIQSLWRGRRMMTRGRDTKKSRSESTQQETMPDEDEQGGE